MDGTALAAYIHPNTVSHSFMESLWAVADYERENRNLFFKKFGVRCGPGALDKARNVAARVFLDQTTCDWLWFVDTDMGFLPNTLSQLIDTANPATRPVVGALYYGQIDGAADGMGGWETRPLPIVYGWEQDRFVEVDSVPEASLVQVAGTGAGCLLIHRSVLDTLRSTLGDTWFDYAHYDDGERLGEDLSFFARLGAADIPVVVHTGIVTTHHKEQWIRSI